MSLRPVYLLDTNMVSYLASHRSPGARSMYLKVEAEASIVLSAITEAEIRYGLEKRPDATRLRTTFEKFFGSVEILAWNSEAAKVYGKLRAEVEGVGKSLSQLDLLIAAHAVAAGAILVSHDRAFQQVGSLLKVVDWAVDV